MMHGHTPVIADLHIHSRYSRATSSRLNPAYLERWARIKGIGLLGTGDCTHPRWLAELREQLADAEPGFFTLREEVRAAFESGPARAEELPRPVTADAPPAVTRFVLTGEISTIYKREGKTRKVHHLVILPDFKTAAAFQARLERIGNISSDGRPILGLDSRDLFAMLLDTDERALLIPAHIWTPWFSALGAKSGFDSIEECYGDLVSEIPAIETGLSSDPPMNWALSSLDGFSVISNSDAHSPDKLGREATIFDMELSYTGLREAMRDGVLATIEFFPEEGKYHYDGHRKCGVCLGPGDAEEGGKVAANGAGGETICPVCGKALTRGVMGRVMELADRPIAVPSGGGTLAAKTGKRRPYHSLIPLREILGELVGTGPGSKKVAAAYSGLIEKAGSELAILMELESGEIEKTGVQGLSGELLAEAIGRMRRGEVSISPGYDGEYGVVRVFPPGVAAPGSGGGSLFGESGPGGTGNVQTRARSCAHNTTARPTKTSRVTKAVPEHTTADFTFDAMQKAIINHAGKRTLVIAGPGTGKTAVLAARIARLLDEGAGADSILALSFTVKAAASLQERIRVLSGQKAGAAVTAATFHSFCCSLLREQAEAAGIPPAFGILGEAGREDILRDLCALAKGKNGTTVKKLGNYIETRKRYLLLPGERSPGSGPWTGMAIFAALGDMAAVPEPVPQMEALYHEYRKRLRAAELLDYEDLIAGTARLLGAKEPIRAEYRRRFRHIFVDEYQDINLSQYVLLRLLADGGEAAVEAAAAEDGPSLWVIGDPNQAIYGFRGSDKRFIDRFTLDYPEARRFELANSFRCAEPVISAAGLLTGSGLRGTETPVDLRRFEYATGEAEAEGVARAISRLIGGASFFAKDSDDTDQGSATYADTAAPGDCAVLIRAAPLAGAVVKALNDHGIPFELSGEQCWWEADPFSAFLARVRESAAPEDTFQSEAENPALRRLFELAPLFGDVRALLDALAYSDSGGIPEYNRDGVRIMSIHASKGLEFDHVFVIGLEDGLLPFTLYDAPSGPASERSARIEEERRLLYVAMTRARIGLYLSWARSRYFKGRTLNGTPSPFLGQLEQIIPLAESGRTFRRDEQLRLF